MAPLRPLSLCIALAAGTEPGVAADIVCGRTVTSFDAVAAELSADRTLKLIPNGGVDFTAWSDDANLRQWFVTKPHVSVVKAVVCRALIQESGRMFMKVESRCFGPKPNCDKLVAGFQEPAR